MISTWDIVHILIKTLKIPEIQPQNWPQIGNVMDGKVC